MEINMTDIEAVWAWQQENARLKKELHFYAHKPNYKRNLTDTGIHLVSKVHKDGGKKARKLLTELGEL
jgi:hypothetical protein